MNFTFFTPAAIKTNKSFLAYIFDMYMENMYYLFGEDLLSEKSRNSWIHYNLDGDLYWRLVLAHNKDEKAGFLIYTLQENSFVVNDIQISKKYRLHPTVLRGLFCNAFIKEQNKFHTIEGYINDNNIQSKNNFLRYADRTEKTPRGTRLYISKDSIFARFRISFK